LNHTLPKSTSFDAFEELDAYLQKMPEYSEWGKNNAKSPQNLWEEIEAGESTITPDGKRVVRVVVCEIKRSAAEQKILMELEQTLTDGRKRVRPQRPMAEKIIGSDTALETLERGLLEELSLKPGDYTILTTQPTCSIKTMLSGSYPGMMSQYERFIFGVISEKLPIEDFTIKEPDGIRTASWGWRTPEPRE